MYLFVSIHCIFVSIALYTLCVKFQVESEIFKINLKIVFCENDFISSELGSSAKRDQL